MKNNRKNLSRRIIVYELLGFGVVIFFLWMDEVFDFPRSVFGGEKTPVNIEEVFIEAVVVFCLAVIVVGNTVKMLNRIKYLEGFLKICSHCKKIEKDGKWIPFEDYISSKTDAKFTHGLCPPCEQKVSEEIERFKHA